jgi:hypothetical protein
MKLYLPATLDEGTLGRICSEYLEMPGLCLTLKQAQRLWGLDEETCRKALALLVEAGFLIQTRDMYRRLTDGPMRLSGLRMARTRMDHLPGAARASVRAALGA